MIVIDIIYKFECLFLLVLICHSCCCYCYLLILHNFSFSFVNNNDLALQNYFCYCYCLIITTLLHWYIHCSVNSPIIRRTVSGLNAVQVPENNNCQKSSNDSKHVHVCI